MNYPKISIVTPSFNQGAFLEQTMRSVLGQGYPNLEYIVIDGGSTDNSVDIIKNHEQDLKFWVSEKDRGMYDAIQKGFEKSTGEIMAWINSDDLYHHKCLFTVAEVFSSFKEVEWLQGNPTTIDEMGRIVNCFTSRKWSKYNFWTGDYKFIQQESTFWKRSLWEKAGSKLRTDLRLAGDFELWLRFFDHASLHNLRSALGAFRVRRGNQFSLDHLGEYIKEAEEEIRKKIELLNMEDRKQVDEILSYKAGNKGLPLLKNRKYAKINSIYAYAPAIYFDRTSYTFKMEKNG